MILAPPPDFDTLPCGTKLIAGLGTSEIRPDLDFETYSPCGFIWNPQTNKFDAPPNAQRKGLFAVGAAKYSEHADTEVLSMAYDLKIDGKKLWRPGDPLPSDFLAYIRLGGIIEAWNVGFEYWIWTNVCVPKYGFPPLRLGQLRCAMAKARAHGLPGSLDAAGNVLNIVNKKHKDGKRLLDKFSIPRNPTKTDARLRIHPMEDLEDASRLYEYNIQDIKAEAEISRLTPDLIPTELDFWLCDQAINIRGVRIDYEAIEACISILEQAHTKYNAELVTITGSVVGSASQIQRIREWMKDRGVFSEKLNEEMILNLLTLPDETDDFGTVVSMIRTETSFFESDVVKRLSREGLNTFLPADVKRVLEIRQMIGSAAVKKLYSMSNQMTRDGRLHDLFIYHGAKTGRAAGAGPQPQNLPKGGPELTTCRSCTKHYTVRSDYSCPWCGVESPLINLEAWERTGHKAIENILETIKTKDLTCVEYFYGNAIAAVSGCLRGLFISAPGHDLVCSDYSAIEAVVLAMLAGEQWRIDVFRTHGKIYEMSASKITGRDFDEYELYKATSGSHHPDRQLGKTAELASGFGGWLGGWKAFGADKFLSDDEIVKSVKAWRAASPAIVEFWGGQEKNRRTEYFGLEGAAISAILNPGTEFSFRGIKYLVRSDVLYCQLLSGRYITYHRPRLSRAEAPRRGYAITYEGWNNNPKYGAMGWQRLKTYGGSLCENVVQATARDILAHAIVQLEQRGYPVVLHIHDEICSEVKENSGSIEEFEQILCTLPDWAKDWPIRATGGWRGKRYRK